MIRIKRKDLEKHLMFINELIETAEKLPVQDTDKLKRY